MSFPHALDVMWSSSFFQTEGILLLGALSAILVVFILSMVLNDGPDPKMALLLSLMAELPRECVGSDRAPRQEVDEAASAPRPRDREDFS